ncbi:MAG: hypothetical protein HKN56_03210, partial [Gammaproteobacteria bacterium]|nr:hypothetical protein [Gammaproteobacteria bacterium]
MKQTRLIAAIAVSALLPLWATTASADGHASRGYGPSKVRVGVTDIDPTKNGG